MRHRTYSALPKKLILLFASDGMLCAIIEIDRHWLAGCFNLNNHCILLVKGNDMALISDIASIGTAIGTVIFSVWMIKQLFSDKS